MSAVSERARALQPTRASVERLRNAGEDEMATLAARILRTRERKAAWHQAHRSRRLRAMAQHYKHAKHLETVVRPAQFKASLEVVDARAARVGYKHGWKAGRAALVAQLREEGLLPAQWRDDT